MTPDFVEECNGRFKVGVSAIVRVTLRNGASQEDVGFGMGENRCRGAAIESAKKEAITDARKRALRLFGNALGNSIYDREYIETLNVPQHKQASAPIRYDDMHRAAKCDDQSPTLMTPGHLPKKQPRCSAPIVPKRAPVPAPQSIAQKPVTSVPQARPQPQPPRPQPQVVPVTPVKQESPAARRPLKIVMPSKTSVSSPPQAATLVTVLSTPPSTSPGEQNNIQQSFEQQLQELQMAEALFTSNA